MSKIKSVKVKNSTSREPISALDVAMAATVMRMTRKIGTETNQHRNAHAATPTLGPGWSRKRLRQHLPDKYAPCPHGSGKRFNLCCWTTDYARL